MIFILGFPLYGAEAPSDDLRHQAGMFVACWGLRCCRGTAKACWAFGLLPLAALPCGHQEYHWDNPKHIKSDFRAMVARVKVLRTWVVPPPSCQAEGKAGEVDSSSELHGY